MGKLFLRALIRSLGILGAPGAMHFRGEEEARAKGAKDAKVG